MTQSAETSTEIELPDRLDLGSAAAIRDKLVAADGDVVLDATKVTRLTSPGLQVLLAARAHYAADERSLSLSSISDDFRTCLADLGADEAAISTLCPEVPA